MRLAIDEAIKSGKKNEVPVGAVIVSEGGIFAKAHNQRIQKRSAIAHAEILAIEKAAKKLGDWRLCNMEIYVTCEPCLMCAGAIIHSRLKRVVYGCKEPKMGAVESVYNVFNCDSLHHKPEIQGRILEADCSKLLQNFFRGLRSLKRG